MKKRQILLASIVAALATMLVPVVTALFIFLGGSFNVDGTPDDTPVRAAGTLLFSMPLIFLIVLLAWYSVARALAARNVLSVKYLFLFCVTVSVILGGIFAVQGYKAFGLRDATISFLMFFSYSFVSLGLGAIGWWLVGFVWHNHRLQRLGGTSPPADLI